MPWLNPSDSRALFSETLHAGALLEHGIAALERTHLDREAEFVPLVLLAGGIERLCKVTLCVRELQQRRSPNQDQLKKLGHRVDALVKRVAEECFPEEYLAFDAPRADRTFLKSDEKLRGLLGLITAHGEEDARYYLLNRIVGAANQSSDPHLEWLRWDRELVEHDDKLQTMAVTTGGYQFYYTVSVKRRALIERLLRAICRLYCPMVFDARDVCAPQLIRWAQLPDSQLGMTDYTTLTKWHYDPLHGYRREITSAYQHVSLATFPGVNGRGDR